jgi:hypothetical protein
MAEGKKEQAIRLLDARPTRDDGDANVPTRADGARVVTTRVRAEAMPT